MTAENKKCPWEKETALCADFTAWAQKAGWTVYSETAGWDLLLVRPVDGFQIGIEAKLSLNVTVLCQVLEKDRSWSHGQGPDCRAVLVPEAKAQNGLATIAKRLGVTVITGRFDSRTTYDWEKHEHVYTPFARFYPELPEAANNWRDDGWVERCPDKRCDLPEYVPDVTGGDSAPVKLTSWKIQAIRAAIVMETWGSITRADFKALGMDSRRWTDNWLKSDGHGGWVPTEYMPNFKAQHPVNYEQIKADWPKWSTGLPKRLFTGAA